MIYDLRTYTLVFGGASRYFALYEDTGKDVQYRILGAPLGYFAVEVGPLNQVVHLWAYESFEDRLERRRRLWAEPAWQAFIKQIEPLLVTQENKLLVAAPFWSGSAARAAS